LFFLFPRPPATHAGARPSTSPFLQHRAHDSYSATLANSRRTQLAAQNHGSAKASKDPFTDVVFTMQIPQGTTLKSYASSPKVGTAPTVDGTGLLTWNMGTTVKADRKVKVTLKLVATSECTTPNALALDGLFAYDTPGGAKVAKACLRKPLYVWANGCPAIPKASKTL
jgi:hypothetical protein